MFPRCNCLGFSLYLVVYSSKLVEGLSKFSTLIWFLTETQREKEKVIEGKCKKSVRPFVLFRFMFLFFFFTEKIRKRELRIWFHIRRICICASGGWSLVCGLSYFLLDKLL